MSTKAFDTYRADSVADKAAEIVADGYSAVGLYYFRSSAFKRRLTQAVADAFHEAGGKVWSIWEDGFPTSAKYFDGRSGYSDGFAVAMMALEAKQPAGSVIYATVDYDSADEDLPAICAYFAEFQLQVKTDGYLAGVYGSGIVCAKLMEMGYVSHTWLSESTGYRGYDAWKAKADIVQGHTTQLFGMDVDTDTIQGNAGSW